MHSVKSGGVGSLGSAPLRSSPLGLRSAVAIQCGRYKDGEVIVFIDSSTVAL